MSTANNGGEHRKLAILFLCTGNSCRSQMAEGWTRHLRGDRIDGFSAGIEKHGMNPVAVKVMAEAGSNLEVHGPKGQRPLHAAAAAGHAGIAAILLSAGCEIDPIDDDGNTPLITAILHGQVSAVELLLAVGADVDIARADGFTAVHMSQLPDTPKAIRELLAIGQ